MLIPKNQAVKVPLLLVDAKLEPLPGQTVAAEISHNGEPFTVISPVTEVANGWYTVDLPPFPVAGPVIFVASSPDSMEWRDIHYVVEDEGTAAIVRAELEKWTAELTLPIKLIRTGATS